MLHDDKVWLVCDDHIPKVEGDPVQYSGSGSVLCLVSPKPKQQEQFLKGQGSQVLYLPDWTLPELLEAQQVLQHPSTVRML